MHLIILSVLPNCRILKDSKVQARIQKILNRGAQTVKIIRLNRGAQIYFLVLYIRANRGRAPGAPPLNPRLKLDIL